METIEYKEDGYDVTLHLRRATLKDGLTRIGLIQQSEDVPFMLEEVTLTSVAIFVQKYVYPACISCTFKIENSPDAEKVLKMPITLEEFESLPEDLGMKWLSAAERLNPSWFPKKEEKGESIELSESVNEK